MKKKTEKIISSANQLIQKSEHYLQPAKEKTHEVFNALFRKIFGNLILLSIFVYIFINASILLSQKFPPTVLSVLPSILIASVGWKISSIFQYRNFLRSENSKAKDYVSSQVEKIFDELESKLCNKDFNAQLEDFISAKVTIFDLRLQHIKRRTEIDFISQHSISRLKNSPLDCHNAKNIERFFQDLRFDILEEIEISYSDHFDKESKKISPEYGKNKPAETTSQK